MTTKTVMALLFLFVSVALAADTQRIRGRDMLNFHNYLRCLHGTQPLVWDNGLAASAQEWAFNRQNAGCVMTHSGYAKLGENVAAGTWRGLTGYNYWVSDLNVVDAWYHEPFTYGSSAVQINHFTQVVWQGTTRVGCAWAPCNSSAYEFWVCQYTPAGNMMTASVINQNVPKPCRTQAQCQFLLNGIDLNVKFGTNSANALKANQINPATYNYGAQTCLTPIGSYSQPSNPFCVTDSSVLPRTLDTTVQNPTSTGALNVVLNCPAGKALSGTGLITCTSSSTWNIAGSCGGSPVTTAPNPPSAPNPPAPTPAPAPAAPPPPPPASTGCWGAQLNNVYLAGYAPGWTYQAGLSISQAKSTCLALSGCGGITLTPKGWEPRAGKSPMTSKQGEISILKQACSSPSASGKCFGALLNNRYLYQYPSGYTPPSTSTLAQAKAACSQYSDCGGVTYTGKRWEARKGSTPMTSSSGEQSYLVVPCAAQAESSLSKNAPWLIPVAAFVGVLVIAIAVVLFRKNKRERSYSSDFGQPEPVEEVTTMVSGKEKVGETNASQNSPPLLERAILESQPTYSQVPMSPSGVESPRLESYPLSPSSAEPTEKGEPFPPPTQEQLALAAASPEELSSTSEWQKMTDPKTGQPYYYNKVSGTTQWEVPDNL